MNDRQARLRRLPSVDALLADSAVQELIQEYSRNLVVGAIRAQLDETRRAILRSAPVDACEGALLKRIEDRLSRQGESSLIPVINATGVIIHTNLGRAPLSKAAQAAMLAAAGVYNTLEFDLETGKRGSRLAHAGRILRDITGAEDALVVNNNASALILILSALAKEREVIISRGQFG